RADEPDALAGLDVEVDLVEGQDPGEALRDAPRPQHRHPTGSSIAGDVVSGGGALPARRSARLAALTAERRLRASMRPSGLRANWMVARPKSTKRHFGDTGKSPGMRSSLRRSQPN